MNSKFSLTAMLAISFGALAGTAHAQLFTTGSLALDGSNVESSGTLVTAVDFYSAGVDEGTGTPTLNGVTFEADPFVSGNQTGAANGNYTVDSPGIDTARAGGVTTTDAVYDLVADGLYHVAANSNPTTPNAGFFLDNLTIGDTYSAQLFFDSSDTRDTSLTDGLVTSGIVTTGPTGGPQFIIDTFVATSATETITINNNTPGTVGTTSAPEFSGFVLDDEGVAPEPSVYAMMMFGLAILGICLRFRRA